MEHPNFKTVITNLKTPKNVDTGHSFFSLATVFMLTADIGDSNPAYNTANAPVCT